MRPHFGVIRRLLMIQVGSRVELRCVTNDNHEAIYSTCEIVAMSPKTIEVKYCSKVTQEGDKSFPVFKRDLISRDKIKYLSERC